MSSESKDHRTRAQVLEENGQLRWRLEESEQTLEAIRRGDVDALVVIGPQGEQVYTLTGAEHLYRVIVETMNEASLTVDPDGTILFCNQRFCDLVKASMSEVMGQQVTTFVAGPQRAPLETFLKDAQTASVQRRLTLRATDGTAVPVQLSASLLQAGDYPSICLVASDLTELEASANSIRVLREHQQAVEESEARFRAIFESSQDAVIIADDEGVCIQANPASKAIFGLRPEELVGRRLSEFTDQTTGFSTLWQTLLATGRFHGEMLITSADERARYVESYAIANILPGRHLSVLRDITERKLAQQALLAANEQLQTQTEELHTQAEELRAQSEELQVANGELISREEELRDLTKTLENRVAERTAELEYRAGQLQKLALELSEAEDRERKRIAEILHDDLQQILAAVKFHVDLMRNRAKYDSSMQTTASKIDRMLDEAVGKSRALSRELSPAVLHHADFGAALGWLAGQIQIKHGLLVHVDAFGKIDLRSDALRAFLYKAAQELLFNVVKHARVNEARVRVRRLGGCICLSVSDRGRGFDPQDLKATTGFGLFSIRERVELLGGRMKIKSIKGHGSKFHIVVPDGEIAVPEMQEPDRRGGAGQRPLRVLIADDHEIVRQGLISLLSEEHTIHVVGEAANGREAVDLTDRLRPDVVIMDVAMPLMDGDEATRQIKKHMPETRVIALSMYEEHTNVEKMLEAGAETYILKTVPAKDLLAALRGRS